MPLSVLLPMVIIGIGGIAILLHVLGLSQEAKLATEDAARDAWLREFPDHPVDRVSLSHTHRAALVEGAWGRGLVWSMGADTTARHLTGAQVRPLGAGLRIELSDVTAPHVDLDLDHRDAEAWATFLREVS